MNTVLSLRLLALASLLGAAACASSAATDPSGGSTATTRAAQGGPAADISGTWAFVITKSDVAVPLRAQCEKTSGGDAAKAAACWNEVATESANEKIRFAKDGAGHAVWTSFGVRDGQETIFIEAPVELTADGPNYVMLKGTAPPKGTMAAQFAKFAPNALRIEVVDARTLAMTDPKKGRLVYTKE